MHIQSTAMHNMANLYTSLRKCRQSLNRVQRHTHLYSTLPLASYPWRHTHAKPLKWTPAPRTLCFWSYTGAAGGVGATPFHLHNQKKHYSLTWLFKSFYKGHFFLRYPVSCITLCFAPSENRFNLLCAGPFLIMTYPFFTLICLFSLSTPVQSRH